MSRTFRIVRAGATKDERLAARSLSLPKEARPILEHTNGSALYIYNFSGASGERFAAIAFWGASARPLFHTYYRTENQRNEAVLQFKANVEHAVDSKVKRAADKAAWVNPLKVGDILHTSWGYDQTNVEFYVVTKVSGRRVTVAEIAQESSADGYMTGTCWPAEPVRIVGDEMTRIAQPAGDNGARVKINESVDAWPGGGKHRFSSYA